MAHGGQQVLAGHPARVGVHLDADEPHPEDVGGLAERRVDGHRGDDRPAAAGGTPRDLPGRQTRQHATLGAARRHDTVDLVVVAPRTVAGVPTQDRADPVDDPAVDPCDRPEDGRVQAVDAVRQTGGAHGQPVHALHARVVDVGEHPAAGRGRIRRPQRGQRLEGRLASPGDQGVQGIGVRWFDCHAGSVQLGCSRPNARMTSRLAAVSRAGTREKPRMMAQRAGSG